VPGLRGWCTPWKRFKCSSVKAWHYCFPTHQPSVTTVTGLREPAQAQPETFSMLTMCRSSREALKQGNKSDKVDARKLAELLRAELLSPVATQLKDDLGSYRSTLISARKQSGT